MIIWILNHYAVPPQLGGGIRHYQIGKYLVARGHSVKIFVGDYHHLLSKSWKDIFGPRDEIEFKGVTFIVVPTRRYKGNRLGRFLNMLDYRFNAVRIAKKLGEVPDVVMASSIHPLAWIAGGKLSKLYKAKFVVEVRDIWPKSLIELRKIGRFNPLALYFGRLERRIYKKADSIIALMPSFLEHLDELGIGYLRKRTFVIPNFLDLNALHQEVPCKIPFNKNKNVKRFVYLGAHGPANDLRTVLLAFKRVRESYSCTISEVDIELHLFGEGPEKRNMMQMVKEKGIEGVYFHDPIPKACVPRLLKEVYAAVFPLARFEMKDAGVSSNKLLEYMANRVPIVSVKYPGLPVSETNAAFFYEPGNIGSCAQAFLSVLKTSKSKLGEYVEENFKYVNKHRSLEAIEKVLREALFLDEMNS